jgi:hypothetical protein
MLVFLREFYFEHLGFWGEFWGKGRGFVGGDENKDLQKDKDFKRCGFHLLW